MPPRLRSGSPAWFATARAIHLTADAAASAPVPAHAAVFAGALCMAMAFTASPAQAAGLPCTPSLSRTQLDLGSIAPADLQVSERTRGLLTAGKQVMSLDVVCTAPSSFAVTFHALPGPAGTYRLGAGANAPMLRLTLSRAVVDGKPATLISRADPRRPAETLVLAPGDAVRAQSTASDGTASRLSLSVESEILVEPGGVKSGADRDLAASGVFEIISW